MSDSSASSDCLALKETLGRQKYIFYQQPLLCFCVCQEPSLHQKILFRKISLKHCKNTFPPIAPKDRNSFYVLLYYLKVYGRSISKRHEIGTRPKNFLRNYLHELKKCVSSALQKEPFPDTFFSANIENYHTT